MPKKLVLFSDGTGNSSAKAEKTNVWRLFEALRQGSADQLAHYDDGVGTSSNKYLAAFGGAFGWGLKRNVIDLYKFVCRNYDADDRPEIHGFGFSRGAYTIRMVCGLIDSQGLVRGDTEQQLHRRACAAFRAYRWADHWKWHHLFLSLRYLLGAALRLKDLAFGDRYDRRDNVKHVEIRFLGLWDTVAAYEMPIVEIKRAMDTFLWPMGFSNCKLSETVQEACHALALDEERETFHPMLWDEDAGAKGRLTQVWFAGVHSNVGGGYPEDRLSLVPLGWIADRAARAGLTFEPTMIATMASLASPFARIYDSRAGAGAFYRYAPRHISYPDPIVHSSVILRMYDGSQGYAPICVPEKFSILAPDGQGLVTFADTTRLAGSANPQEAALGTAMGGLSQPSRTEVDLIWDTVWWRRTIYFVTMFFSTLLLVYPAIGSALSKAAGTTRYDLISTGIIAGAVGAISAFVPDYLAWWLDAMRDHPLVFAALAAGLAYSLYFGSFLGMRIEDRAVHAWQKDTRTDFTTLLARREGGAAGILLALALVAAAVIAYGLLFPAKPWQPQAYAMWGFFAITLFFMSASRASAARRLRKAGPRGAVPAHGGWMVRIARFLRTWSPTVAMSRGFVNWLVPLVFLGFMGLALVILVNKAAVEVKTSVDSGCPKPSKDVVTVVEKVGPAATEFHTNDRCWASGLFLEKDGRYRIAMEIVDDWFDADHRADLGGFPTDTPIHAVAAGFKHWWWANWLQPVARIGVTGNDEYVLAPVAPFTEHIYMEPRPFMADHSVALAPEVARAAAAADPTPADRRRMTAEITARTAGELFLYVNDALVILPDTDRYLRNNLGSARVTVERVLP